MFTIFFITLIWFLISYELRLESLIVFAIFSPFIFYLYTKLSIKTPYKLNLLVILSFLLSVIISVPVTVLLLVQSGRRRVYRGIYEIEVGDISDLDLFVLSCNITVIPNTIFIIRSEEKVIVHKIAPNEEKAHSKDKLIFPKKNMKI